MTSPRVSLDGRLDEWGSRLFNVSRDTPLLPRRSKRTPLGFPKPVSPSGRLSTSQARATYVRQKLQAMVRCPPQVVVNSSGRRKACEASPIISPTFRLRANSKSRIRTVR